MLPFFAQLLELDFERDRPACEGVLVLRFAFGRPSGRTMSLSRKVIEGQCVATRSKKLLGAPGCTSRNKDATRRPTQGQSPRVAIHGQTYCTQHV